MKFAIYILTVFMSLSCFAGNYACGALGLKTEDQRKAFEFLSSLQGNFQLGSCYIEVLMCDPTRPMEEGRSTVGDMLVVDRFNQKFYLAFDFSTENTEKTRKVILNGKRAMHYEFIDRLHDEESGRTEAYRMEFLKSKDLSRIESFDLGIYTSRLREEYPKLKKGKSYWVNCGASEE